MSEPGAVTPPPIPRRPRARDRAVGRDALAAAADPRMLDLLDRFTDVKQRKIESGVVELTFSRRPAARIHHG